MEKNRHTHQEIGENKDGLYIIIFEKDYLYPLHISG